MDISSVKIVGQFSIPSRFLASFNPAEYREAMRKTPIGAGSCACCDVNIIHHVLVQAPDSRQYFICAYCATQIGQVAA